MKINLTTDRGVIETIYDNGILADGIDLKQYVCKNLWDDLQGEVSDGNVGEGQAALNI